MQARKTAVRLQRQAESSAATESSQQQTAADTFAKSREKKSQLIVGNQAAQQALQTKRMPMGLTGAFLMPRGVLQRKLTINEPGDVFEQEADRVADAVMRSPTPPAVSETADAKGNVSRQLQRECACGGTCDDCREKARKLQRAEAAPGRAPEVAPPIVDQVLGSPGAALDEGSRTFMECRLNADFSNVRVHADSKAAESAQAVNARAYTVGKDVVFGKGQYEPSSQTTQRLLAHELTHVVQQGGAGALSASESGVETSPATDGLQRAMDGKSGASVQQSAKPTLQRAVRLNVKDWSASKFDPPVPQNGQDPSQIDIPTTAQINVTGTVEVDGDDDSDDCSNWNIGTMQVVWTAWTILYYRGQTPADGKVTASHHPPVPIRDPSDGGDVWYDNSNVRNPDACGDQAIVEHLDGPGHSVFKMTQNTAVDGSPVNYLRGYTRGLHAVTYLTATDPDGNFIPKPLRFVYWNSLQDFAFTPDFNNPLDMWSFTGQVRNNIGSKGVGETADAPYFTTSGPTLNQNFNDVTNWNVKQST